MNGFFAVGICAGIGGEIGGEGKEREEGEAQLPRQIALRRAKKKGKEENEVEMEEEEEEEECNPFMCGYVRGGKRGREGFVCVSKVVVDKKELKKTRKEIARKSSKGRAAGTAGTVALQERNCCCGSGKFTKVRKRKGGAAGGKETGVASDVQRRILLRQSIRQNRNDCASLSTRLSLGKK